MVIGGYLGTKIGDALGFNKLGKYARGKKAQEKNDASYYLNKNYKIESLV